ncbi:YbfB/YjiJ family MFS transporter [Kyrpidia spormannii]|uniref:MFS transporter n=1 Tax=Kyrpidia spormannii TaxID=2055160 RepID=A0ACA8ZD17_9BACL|nr:YbfB/YjiJ family MFS transporter [Kyrpidia spormannii]CAB3395010.1 MFS transporter [Kyrpidia spormannii]
MSRIRVSLNQDYRILAGGVLALFIAMGIGRFAFTPILPFMQADEHVSGALAGYLASSNYLGYLVGAFVAGLSQVAKYRVPLYRYSLAVSIITTGAMGVGSASWRWLAVRFLSGIASGLVFVLVSSMVLDALAHRGRLRLSGIFYGGVGLGIAATGIAVATLGSAFGWRGMWLAMTALGIVLGVPAARWMPRQRTGLAAPQPGNQSGGRGAERDYFPWLLASYGCEGAGYIITGTFLVSLAAGIPELHAIAPYGWIVVGIAAIPSCWAWSAIAERKSAIVSLAAALVLQAVGVVLPVVMPNPAGLMIGAILFGGTFMGITTMATGLAKKLRPEESSRAIGLMTGVYGVGQIIGAAAAGVLADRSGGFALPMGVAATVVLMGAGLLVAGKVHWAVGHTGVSNHGGSETWKKC